MPKTSVVWEHFKLNGDKSKAVCQICNYKLAYHGGTTCMKSHLKAVHPEALLPPTESIPPTPSPAPSPTPSPIPRSTLQQTLHLKETAAAKRNREITDAIVDFIAMDMRPINVVEGDGFRHLIKALEPTYTVPRSASISRALCLRHSKLRDRVAALLESSTALSFTTYIWTSVRMEAYMAVTCHFITPQWELCDFVLETAKMEARHTGFNITQQLGEALEAFNIPDFKRVAVVHDNAGNVKLFNETLEKEKAKWGNVHGICCSGHTVQLCVNAAMKQEQIRRTVTAARNLVGHFKKSAKATAALHDSQKHQSIPEHKLLHDVATRWTSTCAMLNRLLEQRWPVSAVLSDPNVTKESDRALNLTPDQWKLAQEVTEVLGPLMTLTELLSQAENLSLSATLPMLFNLKRRHLSAKGDDSPAIAEMKKTLVAEIDSRWQLADLDPSSLYLLSSALDQRFKQLRFLDCEKKDLVYTEVVRLAELLHQRQVVREVKKEPMENDDTTADVPPPAKKQKKQQDMSMLMLPDSDDEHPEEQDGNAEQEMEQYLADYSKVRSGPLGWWKQNCDRYPMLALAAKYCLCVPATSSPGQRISSKAGYFVGKTRKSLLPENVDKLIFLAHNMKKV